ncbi:MAG: peptidylprolyl isomerase [Solirubrobacterales bacterium]|nr:peptidylprolyl isomerase [Solirubrobacterales bacterium]
MALTRKFSALCAFFVVTALLAACGGGGIPGDAVVQVGSNTIKKATFQHWLDIAAISTQGAADPTAAANGTKPKVNVPVPPDFTACVANKKKTAPKPAKGQPQPTDTQFKAQCKTEYEGLRDQVLQFLISSEWISGEAGDQGVKVTDKEVQKQFDTTKKQSFPKEADFQTFLKSSGMTLNDLLFRVKLDTLSNKLRTKITKGKDKVSAAQIQTYYTKNKARFAQPERRDLRIVLTKTKTQADRALSQLKGGTSFGKVAKSLSIDQASKNQGGVLLAVAKGQQEKALDDAVFAAAKGKLSGPVKTQFGYYVFKVQKITPATQQTVKEATPTIKQLLASQNQQTALDKFVKDFRKKWKDKTDCRSGFVTQDCKNAPKQKTTSTAATQTTAPPATGGADTTTVPPPTTTTP